MLQPGDDSDSGSALFEAAFEHAAMGAMFVAPDLRILRANQALATMLGQHHEELTGLDVTMLTVPEDRDAFRDALRKQVPGFPSAAEVRLLRRESAPVWTRIDMAAVASPAGFVLQVRDMTVRRRLDMEHALTVEVFRILDQSDDPSVTARSILSATRQALGIEAAAIRLAREGDFTYAAHEGFPLDFIAAENCLRSLDANGEPAKDDQGRPVLECTCGLVLMGRTDPSNPIFTASGCVCVNDTTTLDSHEVVDARIAPRDRCVHSGYRSVALIPIRSHKDIIGLLQLNDHRPHQFPPDLLVFLESIASFVGIALERKRAQDRLARSYELLTQALAVTKSGQWSWDLRHNTVEWSESHFGLVGLASGEVKPSLQAWMTTVHPDDRQQVQKAIDMARFASGSVDLEWRALLPDGTTRWLMSRCHVERDAEGEATRYTGITLDITERRAAEERRRELERAVNHLQRLEGLGRLAKGVAHDMNNVLGVILAIGSFLQESQDPRIVEDAERLVRAATRGREMVKGLQDFSRKELQSARDLDLNEIARREADLAARTCSKRIAVSLDLEPDLPKVFGEGTSIHNAVMNLCMNAIDALSEKGTLTLRTRRIGNERVELVVEDDGEGMPSGVLTRAMEPFFTTKPLGKGTGLGLAQVYGTMKAHSGTVGIESTPGKGTQVRLTLPVSDKARAVQPQGAAPAVATRGLSVLVIAEDSLRSPVLNLLKSLGHGGQGVDCGPLAVAKMAGGTAVDLVLFDLDIPELDVEILHRLRAIRPDLPILLAASGTDERVPALLDNFSGMRTLIKPFGRRELAEALAPWLVARAGLATAL